MREIVYYQVILILDLILIIDLFQVQPRED